MCCPVAGSRGEGMPWLLVARDIKVVLAHPRNPYTEALLSSIPPADPDMHVNRIQLQGEVPSPANPPSGCIFHPRCNYARPECREKVPELQEISPGHFTACHFAKELSLKGIGDQQ